MNKHIWAVSFCWLPLLDIIKKLTDGHNGIRFGRDFSK